MSNKVRNSLKQLLKRNKVDKHLFNDLRVQLTSIALNLKPSYLWEIGFGDSHHVFDVCNQLNVDLSNLQVIQIKDMLFIANGELLLRHLRRLIDDSFDALVDVSPELKSPQLLSKQQIETKKCLLKQLLNELDLNSMKNKLKIESIDESVNDMCFICGALLGYPLIYTNNDPQEGNCLSFEPLSHFWVENESMETIYSFSCPQKFQHIFDSVIKLWFESIKRVFGGESLQLKQQIKTLPLVLT